ncbi:replication protein A [Archaeoglobus profundus]|uniref:Nucleic acid binding OB-fold tRNA/helicase-type n=1 Tax=Archaeoglobus profundus (strain DSM 5631 / JCM 9629 / NBRC 100127 / Av18) TaxID=572546 RepID=D2RF02_ARCPA|nr:replication protein A [Archaeoglobus profundus]ADB58696.1 nucleic acid binding OB-fold tRNA/helicase-type [Archaeoglobus profundus DSM 5631]
MEKIESLADQIISQFKSLGYDIDRNEVVKRLKLLIHEFKVPENEAVRTVRNWIIKEYDIPREKVIAEAPLVKIKDITKPGQWVSLKAKVVQIWDSSSPSVSQVGLIGDETGIIKFVIWAKSGKREVEEGKCYLFKNVVTDSFQGRMQINVGRTSEIIEIDEDIPLPPREIEVVGALVAIQQNSGLIQRCEKCHRVMTKGICPIHGKVKGYDDLRIKGVLDDGENIYEIILNEDNIKDLTGIDLQKAKQMASERLDRNAVLSELKKMLLGRYFKVVGVRGGRYLLGRSVEKIEGVDQKEIDRLLEVLT